MNALRTVRRAALLLRRLPALVVFLLCCAPCPPAAAYKVEIDAPAPLKGLLAEFLDLARYQDRRDLNEDQLNFMIATVAEQVQKLAATEGFFSPRTTTKVERESGATTVRLSVEPGPRTTVSKAEVDVVGAADLRSPRQVEEVRGNWALAPGKPFRQQDWSNAKETGLRLLQNRRYPAARIADSEARIDPGAHDAELAVTYDSGPLFTLGPLDISGARRYPETIIRNVSPLRVGEEYDVDRLLELQRQIQRTPYFSNAVIDIDRDPARAELAPVNVRVTEYPTQRIRAGVGYTTDTGAHVDSVYSHNNVFGRAWVFEGQARLEQRRQIGSLNLSMPPDGAAFVNNAHASIERTTLEGVDLRSRRAGVQRSRSTDRYDLAYTLEYYNDELQQLSGAALPPDTVVLPGVHRALVAGASWTRRRVDNPVFPRHGYILSVEGGGALKGVLTDQSFVRVYSRLRNYHPVGALDLVLLRGELGAVISKGGNAAIPASLLFRAGGTESVRGYSYQSIGNEQNGTVYPTRYLATGGVEYQHWFGGPWGVAVFYDVGTATDRWSDKTFFQGIGVGARWRSPVGRINVDIAYGLQRNQIRPHLALGAAF